MLQKQFKLREREVNLHLNKTLLKRLTTMYIHVAERHF